MSLMTISKQAARRLVLGRQGLWPGRRYQGKSGVAQAIRASECIQVDTISIIARSHDLALFSRVHEYNSAWLNELCYQDRLFFDYGTILMLYPTADLPYFQTVMQRFHQQLIHAEDTMQEVRKHVLDEIARRGPLANRDFTNRERIPGGFNVVKDTSKALYHLYLCGHVMTRHRRNFERVYDLAHHICVPGNAQANGSEEMPPPFLPEAERFFALKAMRDLGIATSAEWARRASLMQHERVAAKTASQRLKTLVSEGALAIIQIEGVRDACYMPTEDVSLLQTLVNGDIPAQWQAISTTTEEEVNFLAPLDNVIWDRARTTSLFDFEYVWEVYKPASTRRWGYYTLPILFGDSLVGRMAFRMERKTQTLYVEGFWLESEATANDSAFQAALERGLTRFARFHQAQHVRISHDANLPPDLRVLLNSCLKLHSPSTLKTPGKPNT